MPADEIVIPSPAKWLALGHLVFLTAYLVGTFYFRTWQSALGILVLGFLFLMSLSQALTPTRLSASGIRVSTPFRFRYRVTVPWQQVSRIWANAGSLSVLLHDPDAVAGTDSGLAARMRGNRVKYSADLVLSGFSGLPGAAEAVARFSGGTRQLERAFVHAVPGSDDVTIRNRFALPGIIALTALIGGPLAANAVFPSDNVTPFGYLFVILVILMPAGGLLLLWLTSAHLAPPVLTPAGLQLRAANLFQYDIAVPWDRVDRIWRSRHGVSPVIMLRVHDADALAGDNEGLRRRMRHNRQRFQADLVSSVFGTDLSDAQLAAAVTRLSHGTRELEHVA